MFIFGIPGSQYQGKVSRQLCSATFDRDGMISRLHMRELNLVPFGDMNGSDKTSLNEKSKLLPYRLKSEGFNLHPWRKTLGTRL